MILIFAMGILAAFISYGLEINKRVRDLRAVTLRQQTRVLLAGLDVQSDGSVQLRISPAWRQAYADASGNSSTRFMIPATMPSCFLPT